MMLQSSIFFVSLAALLTKLFIFLAKNTRLVDQPNERSMHINPTIRGGGVVFIGLSLAVFPVLCFLHHSVSSVNIVLFISGLLIALVSFMDDLYQLSSQFRLIIQLLVSILVVIYLRPSNLDFIMFNLAGVFVLIPFIIFAVIWSINLFNFMDGLDGFCAAQAIFLFASYALFFSFHDAFLYQDFCFMLVFSLLGFFIFNFPPARLFMGDIGSATLGLLSFSVALIAQQQFEIAIIYWFILNALFLIDSTITLLRRLLKKENLSTAHRKHAYQRLKQSGFSTRAILLGQSLINIFLLTVVLLYQRNAISLNYLLLCTFTVVLSLYWYVETRSPMFHICQDPTRSLQDVIEG